MRSVSPFILLSSVACMALLSYTMARSPLLPIFSKALGAGPELIGFIYGASTITGILVKLPAGALSDVYGRRQLLRGGGLLGAPTTIHLPWVRTTRVFRCREDRDFINLMLGQVDDLGSSH